MHKRFTGVVFLCIVMLMVQGCSFRDLNFQSSNEKIPEVKENETTLKVALMNGWIEDIDRQLALAYEKMSGKKIEFVIIPDDQYSRVLKTSFAVGEGPDIFWTHSGVAMFEYLAPDKLLDLTDQPWVSRMTDTARQGVSYQGRVLAFNTWSVDGWGMLYNPDIFKKCDVGVPTGYVDFLQICEKIKSKGYIPIYEPGSSAWHDGIWLNSLSAKLAQKYEGLYDKLNTNKTKVSELTDLETALEQMQELVSKGYFGENFMSNTWEDMASEMAGGKYAMGLVYTTFPNEMAVKVHSSAALKWEMFPVPLLDNKTFATSSGGLVRCINKDSKSIEAAKEYFNFLATPENIRTYYSERPDLGPTAFKDVEGTTTEAYKSIIKNATDGTGIDFECGVLNWDQAEIGELVQDLYSGGRTPRGVLKGIDAHRESSVNKNQ